MKNKKFYNLLVSVLIFGSCFLYFKEFLIKIVYPNDYYLSCTDFGQYNIQVKDYLQEGKSYLELIKVSEDPGFYIIASNLVRVANIPSQNILTLLSMLMYCFIGFCLFLLCIQQCSKNKYLTGVICIFLYISLSPIVESSISGIWRQIMGSIFFLIFLISRNYPNKSGYIIVGILSGFMFMFTHRILVVIGFPALLFILAQSWIWNRKVNKKNFYFFITICVLILPYMYLFSGYVLDVIHYKRNLASDGDQMRGYFTLVQESKFLGYSFFGPRDERTALAHFLLYQSYIFIYFIASCKNALKKTEKTYVFVLFFLFLYIAFKFDFSVRVLLLFQIIMIPIVARNSVFKYSKYITIFFVVSIFGLGFLSLSGGLLKRAPVRKVDEGIYFLLNNIKKDEKHYFLSSACGADLLGQFSFTSYYNFHMQLVDMREKKANNELDVYDLAPLSKWSIIFLKRDGILFDFFRDRGRVFLLFTRFDQAEVARIKSGKSHLLGKEYLHLLYPQNYIEPGVGVIKYIFEVDTSKIIYTDGRGYLKTNIQNFNLGLDI